MDFFKEYDKLNEFQKKAVDTIEGPLTVIAGPGTGKTQLLSMRTANILNKTDTLPENILCLTFTEAAADNMRQRLNSLIGLQSRKISIFTFHGFGSYIIQQYPEYFNNFPLLTQLNELGEYELLEKLLLLLSHDNPISKKVDGKFLHISSITRNISLFKRAGLTPKVITRKIVENELFFKESVKILSSSFENSPSSKEIIQYTSLLEYFYKLHIKYPTDSSKLIVDELSSALESLDTSSKYAKPVTQWRNKWLTQIKVGEWHFKDEARNKFLKYVVGIYDSYQTYLEEHALYTFDDMILRSIIAIENNEELKLSIQEKFQYVLVDEYQDTNGAQDKILDLLSDNPVNEGKPNLMIVGDDDQAIYRFQGADSTVMQEFINKWSPEVIVLTDNYRSGQSILDIAKNIIDNSESSLTFNNKKIDKILISRANVVSSSIEIHSKSEKDNYINISKEIKNLISNGEDPKSIAVLAPKHKYLEALVPYLIEEKVPVNYERREQILLQPRIIEILDIVHLINSASNFSIHEIEVLLPKILASKYWELNQSVVWDIAIKSRSNKVSWLETIENYNNSNLLNFAKAIKVLSLESKNSSFELILSYILGLKSIKFTETEKWFFPWKEYYFSNELILKDPSPYLNFLSQLDTLKRTYLEWDINNVKLRSTKDFVNFIKLFEKTNIKLNDVSPYTTSINSVTLLTVYKAKGLEWENVILLNVEEDVWGTKTRSRNESFSLPNQFKYIEPISDSGDDLIRLFYVGITRAKRKLILTSFETKGNGRNSERLLWLDNIDINVVQRPQVNNSVVVSSIEAEWLDIYTNTTNELGLLLKPVLDDYKLSSTHLLDFLDITRGGPKYFLQRHLLKIPEEINTNAIYGDSIHKTLEFVHNSFSKNNKLPSDSDIKEYFNDRLIGQPLTSIEFKYYSTRGEDTLIPWLKNNQINFNSNTLSEYDFSKENITIGEARITGKIDLITKLDEDNICVIDYKTSSPLESWKPINTIAAIKVHNYKYQLEFYKLLVDNSNRLKFKGKANKGVIEFISYDNDNKFINLDLKYNSEEINRLQKLINIVWNKIIKFDLPDTEIYKQNFSGIQQFEDDLLNGKI